MGTPQLQTYPHCAQSALWSQSSLNPSSHSLTCSYPLSPTPSLQSSQQREQVEPHFRRNEIFFPQTPPTPTPPRSHGPAQESNGEPVWYHPAAQTLGPMLCRQGDPQPPARVCALPCPCPSSPTPPLPQPGHSGMIPGPDDSLSCSFSRGIRMQYELRMLKSN